MVQTLVSQARQDYLYLQTQDGAMDGSSICGGTTCKVELTIFGTLSPGVTYKWWVDGYDSSWMTKSRHVHCVDLWRDTITYGYRRRRNDPPNARIGLRPVIKLSSGATPEICGYARRLPQFLANQPPFNDSQPPRSRTSVRKR